MSIQVLPYEEGDVPKVVTLNQRLIAGNGGFIFPATSVSHAFPNLPGRRIYQELFVAKELVTGEIHGGYVLKTQPGIKNNAEVTVGNYQLPLSEGIIDPKYGMVGVQLYLDAIKRRPMLYSLGMGSLTRPLPQFLKKMKWEVAGIPFYFKIVRPGAVIKNLPAIRENKKIKPILFFLENLYLFSIGISLWNFLFKLYRARRSNDLKVEVAAQFEEWADEIFEQAKSNYTFINTRTSDVLNILYPKSSSRFIRLRVKRESRTLGWALVLRTQMKEHKQFPNLTVGTIADCLALPGSEQDVILAAQDFLMKASVDLMVSNQSHEAWTKGLSGCGFLAGPTNFIAAFSPKLWEGMSGFQRVHINRGDGDGPINL